MDPSNSPSSLISQQCCKVQICTSFCFRMKANIPTLLYCYLLSLTIKILVHFQKKWRTKYLIPTCLNYLFHNLNYTKFSLQWQELKMLCRAMRFLRALTKENPTCNKSPHFPLTYCFHKVVSFDHGLKNVTNKRSTVFTK